MDDNKTEKIIQNLFEKTNNLLENTRKHEKACALFLDFAKTFETGTMVYF